MGRGAARKGKGQCGHHGVAERPALGGQGGQREHDPFLELAVRLVGGQERHLVHKDHLERVLSGRGVLAVTAREAGGTGLHTGHLGFEHLHDGQRGGGVGAVGVEDDPAVGQLH
jgi:hypothetical protein